MFSKFGSFAQKYKYPILAGWFIITALLLFTAPSLSQVGVTDQSQFLPQKTESVYARNLLDEKFGAASEESSSSALIVVYNENGLNQQDMDRAKSFRDWLASSGAPEAVSSVISVFDNEALRSSLVSADNTTMMMSVSMSVPALDDTAKQAVSEIRAQFKQYPGTSFYFTGTVGFLHDLFESIQRTIEKTTLVTVILVIILLLIVYRSPIAALVPLVAIGFSFLVTRGIIGFLAQAGVPVSTVTDAYMVVTIFGVGTDYCLFIISRFREELAQGDRAQKIEFTMKRIGPIIVASAITVIIAFLCLSVSQFGMTRTSGWALAIGIAVTLVAGLTLVPALMSLFGRHLFWPSKTAPAPVQKKRRLGWAKTGEWIARHPVWTAVPIIIVLALCYIGVPGLTLSANILTQLPKDVEATQGLNIVREHFAAGELSPLYLLIQSPSRSLLTPESLRKIEQVAKSLTGDADLSRVDYFSAPGRQLTSLGTQVRGLGDMMGNIASFDIKKLAALKPISGNLQALAINYPGIVQSPSFTNAITYLTQVSAMLDQLGAAKPAELVQNIPRLQQLLYDLGNALTSLGDEFELNGSSPFVKWLEAAYFSADGTVTRINLILKTDPYSDTASRIVPEVREAVAAAINDADLQDVTPYVGGETALHTDMLKTSNDDFTIVIVITAIGILAVIIILLRSLLAPLYMVVTVLFNFGATLGITAWIFQDILKYENLINMLPVFVFVMLAAVGADYNIFLVSRIREEAENKSIKEAVHYAVANTGNVITSCGIILAGTFATLASSSFPMVLEIGTSIAVGVLIDTFLVRALLVPSLAVLSGRWSWWPSSLFRKAKKD
jgi:RND superfamily putative drug exporter